MDVVEQISSLFQDATGWVQILGGSATALALSVGGFLQITGGQEGARKARGWYVGAVIGFIVVLGASAIADFLQTKITF